MGPTEKLVALDAFLAGIAGVGGEAVGRSDAAAVGVAFAAGFAGGGFDGNLAELTLEESRKMRRIEVEEGVQTAAHGGEVKVEVGGESATPKRLEKEDAEASEALSARASMLAEELADCQIAGHSSAGYELISTFSDGDLPGVIAAFCGDLTDEKEHNFMRAYNANFAFAQSRGYDKLRDRFAAFFGECCAGEHKGDRMARDWSRGLKNEKKADRLAARE